MPCLRLLTGALQALPKLVALTLTFDTSDARRFASSTLLSVDDSKRRNRKSVQLLHSVASTRSVLQMEDRSDFAQAADPFFGP